MLRRWLIGRGAHPGSGAAAPPGDKALAALAFDMPDGALGRYLSQGMETIEGWGATPFTARLFVILNRLQGRAGVHGALFELGVHHGRAAILFALMARPGERAVFLDLFEDQDANIDRSGQGNEVIFRDNLDRWAPGSPVEIVQGNSLTADFGALPGVSGGVRLAHVDGGHHLEAVLNDLRKTAAILGPGGIVVVDDFLHSGFPEVNEGCHRFLADAPDLVPVALGQNKLVLARRAHADGYREGLAAHLTGRLGKRVRLHGHEALCLDIH